MFSFIIHSLFPIFKIIQWKGSSLCDKHVYNMFMLHLLMFNKILEKHAFRPSEKIARMLSSSAHRFSVSNVSERNSSRLYWWSENRCTCKFGCARMLSINCSCSSLLSAQHVSVQWTVGFTGVTYMPTPGYWFILSRTVRTQACPKVSNFSNLWISADARRELFRTIQSDLVYWFDQFTKKNRFKRTIRSRTGHH